ncbi:Oidioi.mRNA.OKI2018_I69.chr1.g616.t1.cds [Oikopleura dioica]|uniref:Oidioi.mRNA.OKI2018_I69.chr1.g616.t1.cds n=1 Tax=Oikopleura dioica TaxID=34765 RepID=A0ABN7SKE9_OIKDI|nr:Oidioi.mRNA.OKI2018_I69.chr1.g616.t1.cds [Oikopleura dioica]
MNETLSEEEIQENEFFDSIAPEWVSREVLFWIICGLLGLVIILSGIICCLICRSGRKNSENGGKKRESSLGIVRSESMSVKYYRPHRREPPEKQPISV